MVPNPDRYSEYSAYDLLTAAAGGFAGIDLRWLRALVDEPDRTVEGIARFAAEPRDEDRIEVREHLILIARYLRRAELIPFLVSAVRDHRDSLPDGLVEAVSVFREAMVEPLIALYHELGLEEGSEVVFLLSTLGVRDPRIEEIFDELAKDDPEEAAFCRETYSEISTGTVGPGPFPIWDHFPEEDDPPFDAFSPEERLVFLKAESAPIRAAAAASFVEEPEELEEAVVERVRETARVDPEPLVRGSCWRALYRQIGSNKDLRTEAEQRFFSPATPVPELGELAIALAGPDASEQVRSRYKELYERDDLRAAAVEAMGQTFDREFESYVVRGLDDLNTEVKGAALVGVGMLRLPGQLGRVKEFFSDSELRGAAAIAYAGAFPARDTPAEMRSLFRKIEKLAGGLDPDEAELVEVALDNRLVAAGKGPAFYTE